MTMPLELKSVRPQRGRPLHLAVRDALHEAISSGTFPPGQRMPSTKRLSEQLSVSLVTAHRALKELVADGVIRRAQGKGTFVRPDRITPDFDRQVLTDLRVGLILRPEMSLADFHYGQIIEGIRRAAMEQAVDLTLLRARGESQRKCDGFLLVGPQPQEIDTFVRQGRRTPTVIVDACAHVRGIASVGIDGQAMLHEAVSHLIELGHRRIGWIGCDGHDCLGSQYWQAFVVAVQFGGLPAPREQDVVRTLSWRPDDREHQALVRLLSRADAPTALIAAGYRASLHAYAAAATAGLKVPDQLSIIGIDDIFAARQLSPPLTTFRLPLTRLGERAMVRLGEIVKSRGTSAGDHVLIDEKLPAELVVRGSTASIMPRAS